MYDPPTLKNRYTGDELKDALLLLAKDALKTCRSDGPPSNPQHYSVALVTTALRGLVDPSLLGLNDYAYILYLKHGIAAMHCKKALFFADGDVTKAVLVDVVDTKRAQLRDRCQTRIAALARGIMPGADCWTDLVTKVALEALRPGRPVS